MWLRARRLERRYAKRSFAQTGEDLLAAFLLETLGVERPRYADIGAYHPIHLSNTYLFYRNGASGVCVEPDRYLHRLHREVRPRDVCLNVGVGPKKSTGTFFRMSSPTLSTFSVSEASRYTSAGRHKIRDADTVPVITLSALFEEYFAGAPDFLSLDTEGLELAILQELDFDRYRPRVMCVETLTYDQNKEEKKLDDVIRLVRERGYTIFADTYINTLFVDEGAWRSRTSA